MQLAVLIAVLCALATGESAGQPVGGALWRTALTLAGVFIVPLAAALSSLRLVRSLAAEDGPSPAECERIWSHIHSAVVGLWLAIVASTMYLLQWPRVVRSDWSLAAWPLVDELLVLAPVVLPLVLLWMVMYRLQYAAQRALARERGVTPPAPQVWAYVWECGRHHLALVLLPVLLVVGVGELLVWLWPALAQQSLWLYVPLLAAMLVFLPVALKNIWSTSPLPRGAQRDRLLNICKSEGAGVRAILIWHTGGAMANAAVAGVVWGLRYVFLTDGLLARLTALEIEAVLRHELAHITRRHMLLRILVLGLPLVIWAALRQSAPGALDGLSHRLSAAGLPLSAQVSLLVPLALAAYVILVVGRYSKWLEHDADLTSCIIAHGEVDRTWAESLARALVKIVGRNESRWTQWLHPSVMSRLAVLGLAVADPAFAKGFRQRVTWASRLVLIIYAAAAILCLAASG